MNLVLAFILLFVFFYFVGREEPTTKVGQIEKSFPAAGVLQSGDRVVSVDGKRGEPAQISNQINSHKCEGEPREGCKAAKPATITVVRDGGAAHVRDHARSTTRPTSACGWASPTARGRVRTSVSRLRPI